jgi:hypothetical protein
VKDVASNHETRPLVIGAAGNVVIRLRLAALTEASGCVARTSATLSSASSAPSAASCVRGADGTEGAAEGAAVSPRGGQQQPQQSGHSTFFTPAMVHARTARRRVAANNAAGRRAQPHVPAWRSFAHNDGRRPQYGRLPQACSAPRGALSPRLALRRGAKEALITRGARCASPKPTSETAPAYARASQHTPAPGMRQRRRSACAERPWQAPGTEQKTAQRCDAPDRGRRQPGGAAAAPAPGAVAAQRVGPPRAACGAAVLVSATCRAKPLKARQPQRARARALPPAGQLGRIPQQRALARPSEAQR